MSLLKSITNSFAYFDGGESLYVPDCVEVEICAADSYRPLEYYRLTLKSCPSASPPFLAVPGRIGQDGVMGMFMSLTRLEELRKPLGAV